jgi:uncharacterized membrane protein
MIDEILAAGAIRQFRWLIGGGVLLALLIIYVVMKVLNQKYGGDDAAEAYEEKKRLKRMLEAGEITEQEYRAAKAVISARERDL